jgi:hypothetical protein
MKHFRIMGFSILEYAILQKLLNINSKSLLPSLIMSYQNKAFTEYLEDYGEFVHTGVTVQFVALPSW